MKNQKTFLLPTDFTEQTYIALKQCYNLARFHEAKIVILNVSKDNDKKAEKKLKAMAEEAAKESGLTVETRTRKGNIYTQVEKVADVLEPEMIVMGLESHLTLGKILGPNAFKLVRESKWPILTIRGKKHRKGCENILLPLDLSKETRQKVTKAIEIAKYYGASIRIVNVLLNKSDANESKLKAYAYQVKEYIKKEGIRITMKTLFGKDTARMIINYGVEIDADLILIMSKAELNIQEFFMGTVAQRIINTSPIPVLSYRPKSLGEKFSFTPY